MIVRPSVVLVDPNADLQAAIDALSGTGGVVQLEPGTYTATWRDATTHTGLASGYKMWLQLPPGVILRGSGPSTILLAPAVTDNTKLYSMIVMDDAVDSGVESLQIQGSQSDGTHGGVQGVFIEGASSRCFVRNVLIAGVSGTKGVNLGVVVGGITTDDLGGHVIEDNVVTGCVGTAAGRGLAFDVNQSSYTTVRDNRVSFYTSDGRHGVYLAGGCTYCVVTGNEIVGGTSQGIQLAQTAAYPANPTCSFNTVSNNTLQGNAGISLYQNVTHNLVTGNAVLNSNAAGVLVSSLGSAGLTCDDNVVSNNYIYEADTHGIWLNEGSRNTVSGNTIKESNQNASKIYSGILLQRAGVGTVGAVDNRIVGNTICGADGSAAANYRQGIRVDGSAPIALRTHIVGNAIDLGDVCHIVNEAPTSVIHGNVFGGTVAVITIASTASLVLQEATYARHADTYVISGTADITSIEASWNGRIVVLRFSGTKATTGVVKGSNLKLASDFAYTPDDSITLLCDGTNWIELARSVNS